MITKPNKNGDRCATHEPAPTHRNSFPLCFVFSVGPSTVSVFCDSISVSVGFISTTWRDGAPARPRHRNTRRRVHCPRWKHRKIKGMDPNQAQSATVADYLEQTVKVYRDLFEAKRKKSKQTKMSSFFKLAAHSRPVPSHL